MKLIKLWLSAGIPVLVLIKEYHTISSYHWKVIFGYENNRFLFNNSGADDEYDVSLRDAGVNYDTAPVGNDVDSEQDFWDKWVIAGGDIVDAITSVDKCTFIPLYPREQKFGGNGVK